MESEVEVCVKAGPIPLEPGYPVAMSEGRMPRLRRLAVVGWIVGGLLGGLPMWAEAAQGLAHRLEGGTGGAAAWGGAAASALLRLVLPSEWTAGGAVALVVLGLLAPRTRRR